MGIQIEEIELFKARILVPDVYAKITEMKIEKIGNDSYQVLFVLRYIKSEEIIYTETFKYTTNEENMNCNIFLLAYKTLKLEFDKRNVKYTDVM
jgi:hypothetical protein